MAKESYYFQHEYDTRSDDKIAALIQDFGATGYGVYWAIVELLHKDENSRILYEEKVMRRIAKPLKVEFEDFKMIIDECIATYELFNQEDGYFYSYRVIKNKEFRQEIKTKRIESGRLGGLKRAEKLASATNNQASANENVAHAKQNVPNPSIGKDSIGYESIGNTPTENNTQKPIEIGGEKKSPTHSRDEIEKLLKERQTKFYNSLVPFVGKYSSSMVRAFYNHWSEPQPSRKKMRWEIEKTWELERRLNKWQSNDDKWSKNQSNNGTEHQEGLSTAAEELRKRIAAAEAGANQ